jgi:uncharacterized protein
MRALSRLLAALGACCLGAAACHRTPEEFVPKASSDAAANLSAAPLTSNRSENGEPKRRPAGCPPDPEPNLRPLSVENLRIADSDSGPIDVEVEIAKGEHDTERGLMYRTEMPEMHGMLFELERDDHAFWMHNTCISLDLLYIDHGSIVGIVESAPILNDEPRRVGRPSEQVLELNAGFCRRHGVTVGQHVARGPFAGPKSGRN